MASVEFERCRTSCGWHVTATLPECPNCGAAIPQAEPHRQRFAEYATLERAASLAGKGLGEPGGCIFGLLFAGAAVIVFSTFGLKRHWSHDSPLHPFFENVLGAALLAGVSWLLLEGGLRLARRRRAEAGRGRLHELDGQLRDASSHLKRTGQAASAALGEAELHLQSIRGALVDLPKIKDPRRVEENRGALLEKALEWLVQAQLARRTLHYVEIRRWQNSLEPMRPDRLAVNAEALGDALKTLDARRKAGQDLLRRLRETLWPAPRADMEAVLAGWLDDCEELEQILRKRKMNLTLRREVPPGSLFDGRARALALWQGQLPEPGPAIEPPDEVRTAFEGVRRARPSAGSASPESKATTWSRTVEPWEEAIASLVQLGEQARGPQAAAAEPP